LRGIRSHGFVVQRSVHSTGRLKSFTAWNAVYRQTKHGMSGLGGPPPNVFIV